MTQMHWMKRIVIIGTSKMYTAHINYALRSKVFLVAVRRDGVTIDTQMFPHLDDAKAFKYAIENGDLDHHYNDYCVSA